jgi:hypothetical protein
MRREDKFVLSHRPYAVDLGSLASAGPYEGYYRVTAAWFRRKGGATAACVGYLGGFAGPSEVHPDPDRVPPADGLEFVTALSPGHYGDCVGRWDGTGYWGSEVPGEQSAHLELLRPMLERFPEAPPGFDGWWTFREVTP